LIAGAVLLLVGGTSYAQRSPYIGYIFPAGGSQGATFTGMLSGQYLDGITNATVSGKGVKIEILEYVKPLNGKQLTLLRDRLRNIQEALKNAKKEATQISFNNEAETNKVEILTKAEAEKEILEIKRKLSNPKNQRPPNPQMAEDVLFKVTIDRDAEPGEREIRFKTAAGHTNPQKFFVSNVPEYTEQETVPNSPGQSNYVTLPVVINGRILPGDVDRYRFSARKGARLVFIVYARQLIPYVADAVPGWFQATLAIYDSKGKELKYSDDFRFNPDPVIYFEPPYDGDYFLEIKDAIYRGREDFVYRIAIGEFPFITGIYPLGGEVGKRHKIMLGGWNLPMNQVEVETNQPGTVYITVTKSNYVSNPVPFIVDALPEIDEKEPNNSIKSAQSVAMPVIINGKINVAGDWDVFAISAKEGDEVVVEVKARRLNSPLDSIVEITDSAGKRFAINDDNLDLSAAMLTHHADSYIYFKVPVSGRYFIHITDSQHKGGDEYGYRLRISPPQPDFELRIVPASVSLRAGASAPITVYALRKDGFTNDIKLAVKSPQWFSIGTTPKIPSTTNQVKLSLYAKPDTAYESFNLVIEGTALIGGKEVSRVAQPAQDMMQAFYYHHLVPANTLIADIIGRIKPPPNQQKPPQTATKQPSAKNEDKPQPSKK
ncbi:MAG: peptidase, partial [Limisphaerales bacterium]